MNIFLAGADRDDYGYVLHLMRYPHRLLSYYRVREARFALRAYAASDAGWIMDSGLFSFMFGSSQGELKTFEQYRQYAVDYVEAMHRYNFKHPIVECDVQKVLGVDQTHRIRNEVFEQCGLEVIYVWHIPEGEDGLAELARKRSYIALSIPELRQAAGGGFTGGTKVKTEVVRLMRVIRKHGNPKVHLLGMAENAMMGMQATSCDATSWESGARFGTAPLFDPSKRQVQTVSIHSPRWKAWRSYCEKQMPEVRDALARSHGARAQFYLWDAACGAYSFVLLSEVINGCYAQCTNTQQIEYREAQ